MNKLTFTISAAAVGSLIATGTASADFQSIDLDEVENGMAGLTTYRVYAAIDAGGEVDAVYGDSDNVLSIQSSTSFYQNTFGDHGAPSASWLALVPSIEFDSFVTIGRLSDDGTDAMMDIGIDWTDFNAGGAIYTDNGTWFATPDEPQVQEVGGRVIIGQFTTDGDLTGCMSLQGKNADLTNWNALSVCLPAPGAIALLGVAGVASRRRRT